MTEYKIELPDEIYVRAVTDKTLSAVRPDSPIAQAEWTGRLKRTKYVRADKSAPQPKQPDVAELLEALKAIVDKDENDCIRDESNEVGFWQSDELCLLLDNARKAIANAEQKGQSHE